MKAIKIVVISRNAYNYFYPGKILEAGGRGAYQMTKALAKYEQYKVYCVVGDFGQPDILHKNNVTIVKAPINNPLQIIQVLRLYNRLDPDIFIEYCASPRLALLAIMKKLWGKKYLYFTASDADVDGSYKKIENLAFYWAYLWGLKNADAIIAQVPMHYNLLKKKYGLDSHVVLSPYFHVDDKGHGVKEFILWVGRAAYYKRPDLFLELVKTNPQYQFVMICNPSPYDKGFKDQIGDIQHMDNLVFYNYIRGDDMGSFFREAKLLVNTSAFEGFSNTFIEAAREYTPVLSLSSNPNNMLTTHKAGFCCKGNFELMKEQLVEMMGSDSLLLKMGKNAFYYAKLFHQIDRSVEKINRIIQDLKL